MKSGQFCKMSKFGLKNTNENCQKLNKTKENKSKVNLN